MANYREREKKNKETERKNVPIFTSNSSFILQCIYLVDPVTRMRLIFFLDERREKRKIN
jgi:hypothetical protein